MKEWLVDPEKMSEWLLLGRTVLIPKTDRLDKVEELKADSIEKLTIGEGTTGTTIINNNVDSSNTTNKTEYGSTNIGTKNQDTTVADYSNVG